AAGSSSSSISGHVADVSNAPIAGVTISDGAGHSAATDANGNYNLGGLPAGTYTLTPSKPGYTFLPTTRALRVPPGVAAQDFVGIPTSAGTFTISGRVTDAAGQPVAGVVMADGAGHTAITDASGNYTIPRLAAGSYILTASKPGYRFSPATRVVGVPANATGQTFTAIPISATGPGGTVSSSISGHVTDSARGTAVSG